MGLVCHLPEVMESFAKASGLPSDTRVSCMQFTIITYQVTSIIFALWINFMFQHVTVSTFKVIYKSLSLFLPLTLPSLSLPPFFSPSLPQQPGLLDFIQPLLSCEQVASKFRQWRLHEQLITNFQCLVVCMTSDQLYTKFVPIMFKYITGCVSDHVTGSANLINFLFLF